MNDQVTRISVASTLDQAPTNAAVAERPARVFFPEIESLRGVAALTVVIFHVFATVEPSWKVFSRYGALQGSLNFVFTGVFNGTAAVTLFFVISGFVLSCNTDPARVVSVAGYVDFSVRRLFRILPAMWGSIVGTIVLNHFYYHVGYGAKEIIRFFMLRDTSINGTFWSLKVELFASFLFPFLFVVSRSLGVVFNLALLLVLVKVALGNSPWPFIYFYCFLLGILTPTVGPFVFRRMFPRVQDVVLVLALLAFTVPVQISRLGYMNSRQHVVFEAFSSFYFICYVLYGHSDWLRDVLRTMRARWLGRVSYSLYVIHYTIASLVINFGLKEFGQPFFDRYPIGFQLLALPAVLLISFVLADISFRLVERPFHLYGRYVAGWLSANVRSGGHQLASMVFRPDNDTNRLLRFDWRCYVVTAVPLAIAIWLSIDIFSSAWKM